MENVNTNNINKRFCLHSPSPSLALLIGNRDVIALVENIQQGPRGEMSKDIDNDICSLQTKQSKRSIQHLCKLFIWFLICISAACLTLSASTQSADEPPALRTTQRASFCWNGYLYLQDRPSLPAEVCVKVLVAHDSTKIALPSHCLLSWMP